MAGNAKRDAPFANAVLREAEAAKRLRDVGTPDLILRCAVHWTALTMCQCS